MHCRLPMLLLFFLLLVLSKDLVVLLLRHMQEPAPSSAAEALLGELPAELRRLSFAAALLAPLALSFGVIALLLVLARGS